MGNAPSLRLIGIDEAGLGPLLGPLCLAAVTIDVPARAGHARPPGLAGLFDFVGEGCSERPGRHVVADSKLIFGSPAGHARGERSVLAWVAGSSAAGPNESLPPQLLTWIADRDAGAPASLLNHPWYRGLRSTPPFFSESSELAEALARVRWMRAMETLPTWPRPLVRVIDETRFNAGIERHGNKARWVWLHVSELLAHALAAPGPEHFRVVVDRLGGRKFYTEGLEETFPDAHVVKHRQVRGDSVYRVRLQDGRSGTIAFRVKADRTSFCAAMASMCAKYLREAAMESFNAYFSQHAPLVRRTLGYVTDARRWLREMAPHLNRLGIDRVRLVRSR